MTAIRDRTVVDYLRRLERALSELPPSRRREILGEIEEHLAETFAEIDPEGSEAAVRNALDRVGDPDDIAAEARERFGIHPPRPSWSDPLAIALLLVGGFVWLVGWVIGVLLLWLSDVWNTRDKILGTLVVPGGLLAPLLLALFPIGRASTCTTQQRADGVAVTFCTDGGIQVLWLLVFAALVAAPILVAIRLGRKLRRARTLADR